MIILDQKSYLFLLMMLEEQFMKVKEILRIEKKISLESEIDPQLITQINHFKSEISLVFICKSTIEDINLLDEKISL